jgi:hypothetical protein
MLRKIFDRTIRSPLFLPNGQAAERPLRSAGGACGNHGAGCGGAACSGARPMPQEGRTCTAAGWRGPALAELNLRICHDKSQTRPCSWTAGRGLSVRADRAPWLDGACDSPSNHGARFSKAARAGAAGQKKGSFSRRTPASRVQDEQVELQMTTAAAAPTAPMVSALEPRSLAHPSHLPMYPHHTPSRVTAQVLGEAQSYHCSSCSRRWSSCGAAQPIARMDVAAQRDCGCRGPLGGCLLLSPVMARYGVLCALLALCALCLVLGVV